MNCHVSCVLFAAWLACVASESADRSPVDGGSLDGGRRALYESQVRERLGPSDNTLFFVFSRPHRGEQYYDFASRPHPVVLFPNLFDAAFTFDVSDFESTVFLTTGNSRDCPLAAEEGGRSSFGVAVERACAQAGVASPDVAQCAAALLDALLSEMISRTVGAVCGGIVPCRERLSKQVPLHVLQRPAAHLH